MSDSLDFHPSLSKVELAAYVRAQLDASFPDGNRDPLGIYVDEAMERVRHCFKDIHIKRYRHKNSILFDHLNGDQYCSFIYLLSRVALENGGSESLCSKLYLLNKRMFGLDIMYDIKMPDIFYFQHPVGTVLGRANYSDYLVVYQRCSTGSDMNGVYPSFGKGVVLFGNSSACCYNLVSPS